MNKVIKLILTAAFLLLEEAAYSQSIYYVSTEGNDFHSGTNPDNAFVTLQHAADIAAPGDSFYILSGTYTGFDIRVSGSPNAPIVFKAAG
ncbi:MAG: carbohydrate-binding cenc domain protein, partial [Ignavibacteria bacterium]